MKSELYEPSVMVNRMKPNETAKVEKSLAGRRVLFISYNGMLEPLGQSQVLPYLRELARRGVRFILLSFEKDSAFTTAGRTASEELRKQLASDNIDWHWLRYHRTPSIPATAYDVWAGIKKAQRLVQQNDIELIHARSHIPATIGLAMKRRLGTKLIFDLRGLLAEEYADANHWRRGGVPYRLTKNMERRALAASDGVVTLTERIWPVIKEWPGLRGRNVAHDVVPCCTNLSLFHFNQEERRRVRDELHLEDSFTLVYSGSIDGWYLTERMVEFFASLLKAKPNAHFMWITQGSHARIQDLMKSKGVPATSFTVRSAKPDEVPAYLSAADAGIAFIKPCFSKVASSPTKYGEYLACGLPLIVNAGIGDSDALITEEEAGVLVQEFTETEYARTSALLETKLAEGKLTRAKSREIARRLFDVSSIGVDRYARLYQKVLAAE